MISTSRKIYALLGLSLGLAQASFGAITITFNYDLDTQGFFSDDDGATKKAALEAAADVLEGIITDDLAAITPGGFNTWTPNITHPGTGAGGHTTGLVTSVAADSIVVYVGGRDLGAGTLGEGGPGGFAAGGLAAFVDNAIDRGETGITDDAANYLGTQTDFSLWGGQIAFNNDTDDVTWHYNHTTDPGGADFDFYSVALHELVHVLGFGTAQAPASYTSWGDLVTGGAFTGTNSKTSNSGANVTLNGGEDHWVSGQMSVTIDGSVAQETLLDPDITAATRKLLTNLDAMGLADIGWGLNITPVPEPAFYATLVGFGLVGFGYVRRKRQS